MEKLTQKEINKKRKPNPLFKGMPSKLKDPACFEGVMQQLADVLKSNHKHKTASSYVKCNACMARRDERFALMKKIGFKSMAQYLEWQKIHTIIRDKRDFQIR